MVIDGALPAALALTIMALAGAVAGMLWAGIAGAAQGRSPA